MNRIKKNCKIAMVTISCLFVGVLNTYATDNLESTKLFTGSQALITALTAAITALALGLTIFHGVKGTIAWQLANEQEAAGCKKKLIRDVGLGVLAVTISGVVTAVFAFYK